MRSVLVVPGQSGLAQQFSSLRADAAGAANLLVHQQLGVLALGTPPTNGQTITFTINGVAIVLTAVGSIGTVGGNVLNPGTAAGYVANVLALLEQPQTTTANGVAVPAAQQLLLSYLSFTQVGTNIIISSNNSALYAPLASFSVSTNVTSGTWTAQTMKLLVEPGVVYVNGTRVLFSGASTPTVTAPSSHPRIDVLTIDNTGTLAWTAGTEATSPSVPAYPSDKIALCELYNVVGETALYDNANQQSGQGYVYNDVRPFLGERMNWGAFPVSLIPDTDGAHDLGSPSEEWNNLYVKSGIFLNGASINETITYVGTAAEAILASAPVAIGNLPNDGGPLLDASASGSFTGTGATIAFAVANNPNRILLVCLFSSVSAGASGSNVAYNGSAHTTIQSTLGSTFETTLMAYLVAPSTGTNNLVFSGLTSGTYSYTIHSYYNSAQSSPIDTSALKQQNTNIISQAITPTNAACLLFACASEASISATNFANNAQTQGNLYAGDAGIYLPPGAWTASATFGSSTNGNLIAAAIKPAGSPAAGVFNAGSAAGPGNGRFAGYIGFAVASASKGATITVYISGVAAGLTSLSIGQQYYLNDTIGTIGTSPGTNTRKAGIAISTTQMLVTNVW